MRLGIPKSLITYKFTLLSLSLCRKYGRIKQVSKQVYLFLQPKPKGPQVLEYKMLEALEHLSWVCTMGVNVPARLLWFSWY